MYVAGDQEAVRSQVAAAQVLKKMIKKRNIDAKRGGFSPVLKKMLNKKNAGARGAASHRNYWAHAALRGAGITLI